MKKILLIGIHFFDYEIKIKKVLEQKGYEVELVYDTPKKRLFYDSMISKSISRNRIVEYQKSLLQRLTIGQYETILVIVGRAVECFFLEEIRRRKKKTADMVLYLWDDISYVSNFNATRSYYDRIYSFDPNDCMRYNIHFLPLFYQKMEKNTTAEQKYDLYCAMTDNSVRLDILNRILENPLEMGRTKFIVNIGRREFVKRALFHREELIEYRFSPISKEQDYGLMRQTRGILDINYPTQTGLSTRIFEAMSLKRKIITTNPMIRSYDFYDAENIQVIDRENPIIDWNFLKNDYKEINKEIVLKYSLDSWIEHLLGNSYESYLVDERRACV